MKRLLLLLAVAAFAVLPAPGRAAEGRPDIVLGLRAEATTVKLLEEIRLRVTLERKRGRSLEVNALRLDPTSVSLRVLAGEKVHHVTRIHGDLTEGPGEGELRLVPAPPPRRMLVRGEPLTLDLSVLAVRAGRLALTAVYRGLPEESGVLESSVVEVDVRPVEERSGVGVEIETPEGTVTLELWPDRALNTVLNFLTLARDGFYDGLTFHRVVPGYLVQGGDPKGDGTGGPGFYLPDEAEAGVAHEKGVVSLARVPGVADTGGSQFFVLLRDDPRLDGRYTAFGRVAAGLDVIEKIAAAPVAVGPDGEKSRPAEPVVLRSVRPVTR